MEHLALYSKNCKVCKYLDPDEKKGFKCHFSKGNTECPAKEIQFAVVDEAKLLAGKVLKARAANDIKTEVSILETVAKRSVPFQHKFKEYSQS